MLLSCTYVVLQMIAIKMNVHCKSFFFMSTHFDRQLKCGKTLVGVYTFDDFTFSEFGFMRT